MLAPIWAKGYGWMLFERPRVRLYTRHAIAVNTPRKHHVNPNAWANFKRVFNYFAKRG